MKKLIGTTLTLFSAFVAGASIEIETYYDTSIASTRDAAAEFLAQYFEHQNMTSVHAMFCDDIPPDYTPERMKEQLDEFSKFANLSEFTDRKIVESQVLLTKDEPLGLAMYALKIANSEGEAINASVLFRIDGGCMHSFNVNPVVTKIFSFDFDDS